MKVAHCCVRLRSVVVGRAAESSPITTVKDFCNTKLTTTCEGFPICFGVFQNYYSALPKFAGNTNIALIGTVAQGLYYLGAPFSAALTKRYPKYQRRQIWAGWLLCILGLVAGSFTASLDGLIATQGVMYGVGFVVLTYPIISMVDDWWVARKGMAIGLISAASGVAGLSCLSSSKRCSTGTLSDDTAS